MVKTIQTTAEFNELIASGKKVIVDFTATWCGPCKLIGPKFDTLSDDYLNVVEFVKVDVDDLSEVSAAAGIRAMPTFQTYHAGKKVKEIVGADFNKLKEIAEEVAKL